MPANVSIAGDEALTLDMVHQFAYCPRRFHLMYVDGRWADNQYTVEGRNTHRRLDAVDHLLPDAEVYVVGAAAAEEKVTKEGDEPPVVSRSVPLASEILGVSAKLDLVATADDEALPIDTKRGRVPENAERSWEPERVQLMIQGLLLREHGYGCQRGMLYFAGSRTRVEVPFTPDLEARTREFIRLTQRACLASELPAPLEDSPKCVRCSLAGICLPDETLALREAHGGEVSLPLKPRHGPGDGHPVLIRRLYPPRPDATPLYVQEQGAYVGKSGNSLVIKVERKEVLRVGLKDVSQLVLCGNVQVSTQTLQLLCEADIPTVFLSTGMWFYGVAQGISLRNAYDRAAQFRVAADPAAALAFAKSLVRDKGGNQRTLLRRNAAPSQELDRTLADIDELIAKVEQIGSAESLLGLEGSIAARYCERFGSLLSPRDMESSWDFTARNRRPPRDPVNAMLSFAYALLAKECTVALLSERARSVVGALSSPAAMDGQR